MKNMIVSLIVTGMTVAILGCSQSPDAGGDSQEGHTHASATPKAPSPTISTPAAIIAKPSMTSPNRLMRPAISRARSSVAR